MATEDRGYLYDAAWNLNVRTNNGATSTFGVDSKNQLTTVPGGSCVYDNNGNLTSDPTRTFSYDDENELTQVIYPNSYRIDLAYDGRMRLRKRTEYSWNGSSWVLANDNRYVYDGLRVIQERDGSNNPTVVYTRGSDLSGTFEGAGGIGGLLARSHAYQSGSGSFTNHNFYHADGGGNITYMVNSSQSVVVSYRYDPFGNLLSSSGTLASANTYRFSSKEWLVNGNLYYFGYRFYDPNFQRWLNRDPIRERGGINLYEFVRNGPIGIIDRGGGNGDLCAQLAAAAAAAHKAALECPHDISLQIAAAAADAAFIAAGCAEHYAPRPRVIPPEPPFEPGTKPPWYERIGSGILDVLDRLSRIPIFILDPCVYGDPILCPQGGGVA